ncbi:hypothetical protein K438DRAFT_2132666 [Mycena galopus ATCC 62051]|nr:hypothetical protein K438DRAFT_2132666 [Mycena galopus ATCC 62051]
MARPPSSNSFTSVRRSPEAGHWRSVEYPTPNQLTVLERTIRNSSFGGETGGRRLRNQLVIKGCFLNYKALYAQHQGGTTRSRGIVNRNELKIRLHCEKYQAAWNVLFMNEGQDEVKVGWRKLRKEDIGSIEDAEDLVLKAAKRKRAKQRRKRKLQELLDHGVEAPTWAEEGDDEDDEEGEEDGGMQAGDSQQEISWIWTGAGTTGTDVDLEGALCVEWAKAYARVRRWSEEVRLLREEFQMLPISLEFKADLWRDHEVYAQGSIAYTLKQEALFRDITAHARDAEKAPELGKGKKRPQAANVDPLLRAMEEAGAAQSGEEDDDEGLKVGDDDHEAEEEQGRVESDEEVVMGGELDDF